MSGTLVHMAGGLAGAVLLMAALWGVERRTRNAGVVDAGWAAALGAMAVGYALAADGWGPRRALVAFMGGLWGARLAWHLLRDRVIGRPEEGIRAAPGALGA